MGFTSRFRWSQPLNQNPHAYTLRFLKCGLHGLPLWAIPFHLLIRRVHSIQETSSLSITLIWVNQHLKMGRMHAPGKGISQSALPYRRGVATWLKQSSDDVKDQIYSLAKKGLMPSKIGGILRDSHGVAQVRFVTGSKILRILKARGLAPDIPEDLSIWSRRPSIRKHLERNRKDKDSKFRLILVESRIHRLARYYKTKRVLAPTWKYESSTASALVS